MREMAVVVYLVARIIAGEAGLVCPPAGHEMVARSIATRRVWWGSPWAEIAREYHARGEPTEEDVRLAEMVVSGALRPNGLPFVLSDRDVALLEMGAPDARVECAGGVHLNGYRRWVRHSGLSDGHRQHGWIAEGGRERGAVPAPHVVMLGWHGGGCWPWLFCRGVGR